MVLNRTASYKGPNQHPAQAGAPASFPGMGELTTMLCCWWGPASFPRPRNTVSQTSVPGLPPHSVASHRRRRAARALQVRTTTDGSCINAVCAAPASSPARAIRTSIPSPQEVRNVEQPPVCNFIEVQNLAPGNPYIKTSHPTCHSGAQRCRWKGPVPWWTRTMRMLGCLICLSIQVCMYTRVCM